MPLKQGANEDRPILNLNKPRAGRSTKIAQIHQAEGDPKLQKPALVAAGLRTGP
jgi:hypothetical protein